MSFEYRELTTKVFLGAGEGDKSPCQHASCRHDTKDDDGGDDCCNSCSTTTKGCDTNSCNMPKGDDEKGEGKGWKTLGLLRQQLRDSLAAG